MDKGVIFMTMAAILCFITAVNSEIHQHTPIHMYYCKYCIHVVIVVIVDVGAFCQGGHHHAPFLLSITLTSGLPHSGLHGSLVGVVKRLTLV